VTGFGLAGHLKEMIGNDALSVEIITEELPLLAGAAEYAAMGLNPAGLYRNRDYVGTMISIMPAVRQELADMVFDPQTSGGLLIALEKEAATELVHALTEKGLSDVRIIASVTKGESAIRLL
jgi:selenide,water dikinase